MEALLIPAFILFVILVPVLVLALLLYAVPVRAAVTLIHSEDRREQTVVIAWSVVAFRISGSGSDPVIEALILDHVILKHTGPLEAPDKKHVEKPAPEQLPGPDGTLDAGELIHIVQRMVGPVSTFLSEFWNRSRFENARGTITLGLGSPAVTGEVYGYYWASRFVLLASRVDIEIIPVFDRVVLELDITVREKIDHPLLVLIAGLDLLRNPVIQDAITFATGKKAGVAGV